MKRSHDEEAQKHPEVEDLKDLGAGKGENDDAEEFCHGDALEDRRAYLPEGKNRD